MGDRERRAVCRRRPRVAALAVVGALALAGCNGDEPDGDPTGVGTVPTSMTSTSGTGTTTGSGTSTVAPVDLPAEAKAKTAAGAEAFARYYFEAVGASLVSADPNKLAGLAAPSCAPCGAFVRAAEALASKGHHYESATFSPELATVRSFSNGKAVVELAGKEKPVRILDASGAEVSTTAPGVITFSTEMSWKEASWTVANFKVL